MNIKKHIIFILALLLCLDIMAQKKTTTIHILNADKADYDERLGKDTQRLIGNVVMRQDSTYFYSDSAYYNEKTKFFDGFGNVHIKVNDSTDIYSNLLKYNGDTKFAELFYDVILKDDSTVLNTEYMTYDRAGHLATYPNKGTITRNDKKLVSKKGYYRGKLKNGGLSGTILSDKAYLVVLADVEIDLIQQSKATVCNSQIVNRYHKSLYFNALFLITTYKDAKFI